jgi:hypothetical protein
MINPFKEINWKPDNAEVRKTGKAMLLGFVILWLILSLLREMEWLPSVLVNKPLNTICLIGIGLGMLMFVVPLLGRPVYYVWFFFAACMGIVMSNLILTLVYYLIFGGMALAMKLFGRDKLRLRGKKKDSYWEPATQPQDPARYLNQY